MEPRKLQVLVLTSQFPHPQNQAAGIFNYQLVLELAEICAVTVVCPLPWFPRWSILRRFRTWYAFGQVPREYEFRGVQVHSPKYLMAPRLSGPFQGALVFIGSLAMVWRLHRKLRFDVIHALWLYPDSVAAGWLAKLLRIPMVPTALGCDVNRMLSEGGKRQQILAMLRRAPSVIAVSEELRQKMVSEGVPPTHVSTIPNGVNRSIFFVRDRRQARAQLGLPLEKPIIVFVGRLSEEKGLPTLIEAAGRLHANHSAFLLYLVGDGPLLGDLQSRVHALGLSETVRFAGRQDHAAVANWFGSCDVFCLPSLREGCPNVVLEALSSGRPVVASRVGGIPDLVREDTGVLVAPGNVDGLANALIAALARTWDERRISESVAEFTWRVAAERYHAAYRASIIAVAQPATSTTPASNGRSCSDSRR